MRLEHDRIFVMEVLRSISGKLQKLKNLHLECYEEEVIDIPINLERLESLKLPTNENTCLNILNSMTTCKHLTKFAWFGHVVDGVWTDDIGEALCKYPALKSIKLDATNVSLAGVIRTIDRLPNLSEIHCEAVRDFDIGNIFNILIFTKLSNLTIVVYEFSENILSLIHGLAEATFNRRLKIKLYDIDDDTIISYQGMVRRNGEILYYAGYDPIYRQTSTGLLNLNRKCFRKIVDFFNINDFLALFKTCKATQNAVKRYLTTTEREWDDEWMVPANLEKDFLKYIGPHIRHADCSQLIRCDDQNKALQLWKNLNQHCIHLRKLSVVDFDRYRLDGFNWFWPNLTKIKLSTCYDIGYKNLCMFNCPWLQELEINNFQLDAPPRTHGSW